MPENIFTPGPTPNSVRSSDGKVLTAPEGWVLLPPGDAALTRRVKTAGEHWVVQEKKGRKVFSRKNKYGVGPSPGLRWVCRGQSDRCRQRQARLSRFSGVPKTERSKRSEQRRIGRGNANSKRRFLQNPPCARKELLVSGAIARSQSVGDRVSGKSGR